MISGKIALRTVIGTLLLVTALAASDRSWAKGGGIQHKANKDFRELIDRGERPEIATCLAATIDFVRHDATYDAVRWDLETSDRAIMQENLQNGRLVRLVRFTPQMRLRSSAIFSESWEPILVRCDQPEDGVPQLRVTPLKK